MNKTLFQVLFSISILLMLIDLTKSSSINNSSVVSNNTNNFDSFNGTKTSFSGEKDDTPSTIQIEDDEFWRDLGFQELRESIHIQENSINENQAKNIILFIGDGMSNPTITAARILKGIQEKNPYPEREYFSFERFPHLGRIKTFNVNEQTPDSASSATAIYSGIKTLSDTLGFDSSVIYDNATSMLTARKVSTILSWAQEAGMDTGFVTTTRVTHATPAALYGHSANRDWECLVPDDVEDSENVKDIAWQLINTSPGNKSKVILGGGYNAFYPRPENVQKKSFDEIKEQDWDYGNSEWDCYREDKQNLVDKWLQEKEELGGNAKLVKRNDELQSVDASTVDYLLGLFGVTHIRFGDARVPEEDPTISEMTSKAIEILQKSKNGFFLMVEGGRIDQAHHEGWAQRALNETIAFDLAIEKAISMVDLDETLVMVTADHSHDMVFTGYAKRGSDPTGLGDDPLDDELPYTLITYANGPGFYNNIKMNNDGTNVTRLNLSDTDFINDREYRYTSSGIRDSATHGGDDVNIFAIGPMAHLFSRTHDQTHIANVMAYSACIGPYKDDSSKRCTSNYGNRLMVSWLMMIMMITGISSFR